MASFNLLNEPWIRCVYIDGTVRLVSLRQLFKDASKIRSIAGDIPQQDMPLLRLALAILYCVYGDQFEDDPSEKELRQLWLDMWMAREFDLKMVEEYLDQYESRFDLFDGERPFFQTTNLEYADKDPDSLGELIADVPKPDKMLFTMRSGEGLESISNAEAARWVVFLQAYDTAGIKSPVVGNTHVNKNKVYAPKGMVSTGWLGNIGGTYLNGSNLFETLMLNWVLYVPGGGDESAILLGRPDDFAPWERDEQTSNLIVQRDFRGVIDALTLQARRIRLVCDSDSRVSGCVICYGDCVTPYDQNQIEQMTAWKENSNLQKTLDRNTPPITALRHNANTNLWRSLAPILSYRIQTTDLRPGVIRWIDELQEKSDWRHSEHPLKSITLRSQGVTYGTQNSVYEAAIDDSLIICAMMCRHDFDGIQALLDIVDHTGRAVDALSDFVRNLQVSSGRQSTKNNQKPIDAMKNDVREAAYARMDQLFRVRIAGFTEDKDPEQYSSEWLDEVHRVLLRMGDEYLAQSPIQAFDTHVIEGNSRQEPMNTGIAQLKFRSRLNACLGRFRVSQDEYKPNSKKEGDTDVVTN